MKYLDPKAIILFFVYNFIAFGAFFLFLSLWFLPIVGFSLYSLRTSVELVGPEIAFSSILYAALFLPLVGLLSYYSAKLSYKNYRYGLEDGYFKKESGVISKYSLTIPYERIQNIDITRGPIERLLGLSSLQIETAGHATFYAGVGGGTGSTLTGLSHSESETIRDELIKRAKGVSV